MASSNLHLGISKNKRGLTLHELITAQIITLSKTRNIYKFSIAY